MNHGDTLLVAASVAWRGSTGQAMNARFWVSAFCGLSARRVGLELSTDWQRGDWGQIRRRIGAFVGPLWRRVALIRAFVL
ncbi:MAG: hypothetical protein AAF689_05515 [Pseudomonadota bacterium]